MAKKTIAVARLAPALEALLEVVIKIFGLAVIYVIFEAVGKWLIGEGFRTDTLLSLVVLPSIYVLKDSYTIFEPFFVKIYLGEENVTVETGILTKNLDSLNLQTVENVEIITSPLGRLRGYSTLHVYSYGSWVELPHVKSPLLVKDIIESAIIRP
ncbi:MAG: PH domain-containing protein [Gammaproteobacteria bacterium]|nr:PH domain-containing protein [Gammaproteobacteria bacterium]